jgi:stage IV sporulation protein FB
VFFEPGRTPYDLNFRLFGVDVRVHPWFWLMSALLGWGAIRQGMAYLLLWIACVFISILIHEFGHIVMGWIFGSRGHIVLYGMGGLAVGSLEIRNRWGRMAVAFAGPAAGLLLWILVVILALALNINENSPPLLERALTDLFVINLFWSLLNLLPIWPLDGGRISREFLEWLMPDRGASIAFGISLVIAGLLTANVLSVRFRQQPLPFFEYIPYVGNMSSLYNAFLFGMLAFMSFQMLQLESHRRPWDREDDRWER